MFLFFREREWDVVENVSTYNSFSNPRIDCYLAILYVIQYSHAIHSTETSKPLAIARSEKCACMYWWAFETERCSVYSHIHSCYNIRTTEQNYTNSDDVVIHHFAFISSFWHAHTGDENKWWVCCAFVLSNLSQLLIFIVTIPKMFSWNKSWHTQTTQLSLLMLFYFVWPFWLCVRLCWSLSMIFIVSESVTNICSDRFVYRFHYTQSSSVYKIFVLAISWQDKNPISILLPFYQFRCLRFRSGNNGFYSLLLSIFYLELCRCWWVVLACL